VTKSRRIWAGHVAFMEQVRNAYKIFFGKPERKRPLGGPRCRWKDNIRIYPENLGPTEHPVW
jgi:hypothetical protein